MNTNLSKTKNELESLVEKLPYLLAELDMDQKHYWVNDAYSKFFHLDEAQVAGIDISTIMPEEQYHALIPALNRVKKGHTATFKFNHKDKNSNERKYYGRLIPNNSDDNLQTGFWMVIDDISNYSEFEAKLHGALIGTIKCLSSTSEVRDPYTADHQKKVSNIAVSIAEELGESPRFREGVHFGGLVHDLGKIYIPQEILSRSGKISNEEFALIKTHSVVGHKIVKDIEFPWPISDMVLQHHERIDGTGYPDGLKGADIIFEAKILAVADVVEAMSSHRPYRPALGIERAMEEIFANRGKKYDGDVVDACIKVMDDSPIAA